MAYEFNHYYEIQNVATGKYVNVLGNHEDRLTSDKYSDTMIYNIIFVRNGAIWLDNERGARYFGYNFKC